MSKIFLFDVIVYFETNKLVANSALWGAAEFSENSTLWAQWVGDRNDWES